MEKIEFEYDITIRVKFEKEEFELLLKAFDDPMNETYKSRCVTPGPGAFMNANKNYFSDDGIIRFTHREIDTCCKVLELASMGYTMKNSEGELYLPEKVKFVELYDKMFDLHKLINKEYERITTEAQMIDLIKYVCENCTDTYGNLQILSNPSVEGLKDYHSFTNTTRNS